MRVRVGMRRGVGVAVAGGMMVVMVLMRVMLIVGVGIVRRRSRLRMIPTAAIVLIVRARVDSNKARAVCYLGDGSRGT